VIRRRVERIELAADGCPTKSITLHRDDT